MPRLLHIDQGLSAAGCLFQAMRPRPGELIVHDDVLSCGAAAAISILRTVDQCSARILAFWFRQATTRHCFRNTRATFLQTQLLWGRSVLEGRTNAVELNGIDEWVLGVHLSSERGTVWYQKDGAIVGA